MRKLIPLLIVALLLAGLSYSRQVSAQAIITPTSPVICEILGPTPNLPTPSDGGSWWVCSTATPIGWQTPTPPPTMTLWPTSPHNTPMPYPSPYPVPHETRSLVACVPCVAGTLNSRAGGIDPVCSIVPNWNAQGGIEKALPGKRI